jgi:hypothetical protein
MTVQAIPIVQIRTDGGTQIRTSTYFDKIDEYTQAMLDGAVFPPLTVFWDGEHYWLADGFHRLDALAAVAQALKRRRYAVECEVIDGSRREAVIYACGANSGHGIQRTNADKQAAVKTMLTNPLVANDDDGTPWTDAQIARFCKVDPKTVAARRPKPPANSGNSRDRKAVRGGKSYKLNTANIGSGQGAAAQGQQGQTATKPALAKPAAPPEPFKQSTEWDHLFTLLKQVDEAIGALPTPDVAAANFPISLAHAMPIARVAEIQRWWQEFTRFWAARDPEIQRHRQEVRDFIRENMNVAAE